MHEPISNEEIAAISKRMHAAAKGPWRSFVEGRDHLSGSSFIRTGGDKDIELTGATADDQDFIAASRQDIQRLLEEISRLKAIIAESKAL